MAPDAGSGAVIWRWFKGSVRASMAVGICTWPLLAATVHVISPSMFFTNLLAAPIMFLILVLGLLSPLALIPGVEIALPYTLSLLVGLLDQLAEFFATVPFGHVFLSAPPWWWLVAFYLSLFAIHLAPRLGVPRVLAPLAWLIVITLLPVMSLAHTEPPGPIRCTALDVGQGQCVVIEVPTGPCVVLDCGSTSIGGVGERILAPYLWERRRSHIDAVFISHADADHVNGLPQLIERFDVGRFIVAETFADDEDGRALTEWLKGHADVEVLPRGQSILLAKDVRIRCLWPDPSFVHDLVSERHQRNEGGFVLVLEAGDTRVALPGDVESGAWLGQFQKTTQVLFAPHQGSRVAGLSGILKRLQPEHIIISARETFPPTDVVQQYDNFAPTHKTWQAGAITTELWSDGRVEISTFQE
ncbi:ComEC/Rec2 family competence protein [Planctomycetota bacterium]|nr:ComEC/Rec2 family competence protein [Planctomycetota bacterium]